MSALTEGPLVLGPLVRYVDETSATIWVETSVAGTVTVEAGPHRWSARTFRVHDHHYALVECGGIEAGSRTPYSVTVNGEQVWPIGGGRFALPAPVIATLEPGRPLMMAFGSCRTSVPHDRSGNRTHGIDALRAYAFALGGVTQPYDDQQPWPDLVLFLGDQVYADETSDEMQEFIESRRDLSEPPGEELKDYEEYAHLYKLAWQDGANRWLLSTLPSAMIFDDHDVRDDWNTSAEWRREMEAIDWWHDRIVAALSSYWVYQHLGNLSPQERAEDEIWQQVLAHDGPDELDLSAVLDAFAERVDREPTSYRWSFARDIAGSRLVVVDSRAARVLEADKRAMLDDNEMGWLDGQMRGGGEHLFVGTSLPFLLPEGLQHLEAFSEALAGGAWGRFGGRLGERLRQTGDLEHWGAFQDTFQRVARMAIEVAQGRRGAAPRTVTFLSGDVHHSYVSQAWELDAHSTILQAVCSPIRNPLPRAVRFATAALSYGIAGPLGAVAARSAKVPESPFQWKRVKGPWFENNIATLAVRPQGLEMRWLKGVLPKGAADGDAPELETVARVLVDEDGIARPSPSDDLTPRKRGRVRSR